MAHRAFGIILAAALTPSAAFAQVVVTEIMYDLPAGSDSGREWIEVYNTGETPVDLTKLRLFENGTNHKITAVAGGNTLIPSSYAVIADNAGKFKIDWPQFGGQLFDSAFSLGNDGDSIILRDASSSELSSVSYQSSWGASGDGNSLNQAPGDTGVFIPRAPSPGAPISSSAIAPPVPKSPASAASKTKTSAKAQDTSDPPAGIQTSEIPDTAQGGTALEQTAAIGASGSASYGWWIAALALAALACASVVAAKYFKKREWDIVEESRE